jgi:hypothetical protein
MIKSCACTRSELISLNFTKRLVLTPLKVSISCLDRRGINFGLSGKVKAH